MKYILLTLLLISPITDINKIARTNKLKKEAKEAFLTGNYEIAIQKYHYLLDSMGVDEEQIRMNLANAYFESKDTTSAITFYDLLRDSENKELASLAYQQLGVIKNDQNKQKEALADFKQALRKNPYNEEARYNYEVLKKLLDEQKEQEQKDKENKDQNKKDNKEQDQEQQQKKDQEQQQDQQKQDQEKQDQQKKDQQKQDKEGEESKEQKEDGEKSDEEQESEEEKQKKDEGKPGDPSDEKDNKEKNKDDLNISPDKLKEMNISEEKAKMILEAMKNQEVQYLQQNKRKSQERPSSNKPDW